MAVTIHIDEASGVAIMSCSGVLQFDQATRSAKELWDASDWPGRAAVWDFRAAQFDLPSSEIRHLSKFILEHQRKNPPEKVAFVTPRDVDYGMARMFGAFRDDPSTAFRVFRDYEEAVDWAKAPRSNPE